MRRPARRSATIGNTGRRSRQMPSPARHITGRRRPFREAPEPVSTASYHALRRGDVSLGRRQRRRGSPPTWKKPAMISALAAFITALAAVAALVLDATKSSPEPDGRSAPRPTPAVSISSVVVRTQGRSTVFRVVGTSSGLPPEGDIFVIARSPEAARAPGGGSGLGNRGGVVQKDTRRPTSAWLPSRAAAVDANGEWRTSLTVPVEADTDYQLVAVVAPNPNVAHARPPTTRDIQQALAREGPASVEVLKRSSPRKVQVRPG